MNTIEFEQIINKTIIPAGIDEKEQILKLEPLLSYISERIPSRLYKYRNFCDNHLSAFFKDQIWVSTAQGMNDGFDARLYFNKKECVDLYERQTSIDSIKAFITKMRNDSSFREKVSRMPGAAEVIQNAYLPEDLISQSIEDSKSRLTPIILNMLEHLPVITQQSMKFCSLSETVTSASMWGQYSDNERGFCIEYDFRDSGNTYFTPEGTEVTTSLYPMIYREERYKVPTVFINYLMQYRQYFENAVNSGSYASAEDIRSHLDNSLKCPDNLMSTKIALYKSLEWQYEKEWRVFCNAVDDVLFNQSSHGCIIKKPTAVYLGRRVSEVNEKILRMLAQEKGIPVYKMRLDDNSATYELVYS